MIKSDQDPLVLKLQLIAAWTGIDAARIELYFEKNNYYFEQLCNWPDVLVDSEEVIRDRETFDHYVSKSGAKPDYHAPIPYLIEVTGFDEKSIDRIREIEELVEELVSGAPWKIESDVIYHSIN